SASAATTRTARPARSCFVLAPQGSVRSAFDATACDDAVDDCRENYEPSIPHADRTGRRATARSMADAPRGRGQEEAGRARTVAGLAAAARPAAHPLRDRVPQRRPLQAEKRREVEIAAARARDQERDAAD